MKLILLYALAVVVLMTFQGCRTAAASPNCHPVTKYSFEWRCDWP